MHPLQTEAVAWVAARKDLLSSFFLLLSLTFYLKDKRALSVLSMTLGCLAKVNAILVLPLIVLIKAYRSEQWRKGLMPYAVITLIFVVIAAIGKQHMIGTLPFTDTILLICKAIGFYLLKFIVPLDLRAFYIQETPIIASATGIVGLMTVAGLVAALPWLWQRQRLAAFGLLWFFICSAPSFGNMFKNNVVYFASDRYVYLALIGLILVAVDGTRLIAKTAAAKRLLLALSVTIIVLLSGLTWRQVQHWENTVTLSLRTLRYHPTSLTATLNLADGYMQQSDFERAKGELLYAWSNNAKSYYIPLYLGQIYTVEGYLETAENTLVEALKLHPYSGKVHFALHELYAKMGREADAKAALQNARALDGWYVEQQLQ